MSIYSFDKDKLKVLDIMAKHIVDKENARLILDSFRFESDRRKAASKLGIREKRKENGEHVARFYKHPYL